MEDAKYLESVESLEQEEDDLDVDEILEDDLEESEDDVSDD